MRKPRAVAAELSDGKVLLQVTCGDHMHEVWVGATKPNVPKPVAQPEWKQLASNLYVAKVDEKVVEFALVFNKRRRVYDVSDYSSTQKAFEKVCSDAENHWGVDWQKPPATFAKEKIYE